MCDSDVSMRSVSRSLPESDNLNIGRAQVTDDLNGIEQQNEGQALEGERDEPTEPFILTNPKERDENENHAGEPMDAKTQRFYVYEKKLICMQPHLRL